jgi:hypothetical protein
VYFAVGAELDRHSIGAVGGSQPVQTGRIAVISRTPRASAGPTVTVFDTGSMDST